MNRSRALQRISVSSLRLSAVGLLAATPLGALEPRSGASPRAPWFVTLDGSAREGDTPGTPSVRSEGSDLLATAKSDPARDNAAPRANIPLLLVRGTEFENGAQEPFDLTFGWEVAHSSATPRDRTGSGVGAGNAYVPSVAESEIASAVAAAAQEAGKLAIAHPVAPAWSVDRNDAKMPPAAASVAGAAAVPLPPGEAVSPENSAPSRPSDLPAGDGRVFLFASPSSSGWISGSANGTIAKPAFSLNAVVSLTLTLPTADFVAWSGGRGELGGNDQASFGASGGAALGKASRPTPGAVADLISPIGYNFNDIALGQPGGRRSAVDLLGQASRFDTGASLGVQVGEGRLEVRAAGAGASSSSNSTARFESGGSLAGGDGGRLEVGQPVMGRTDRGSVQASNGSGGRQPIGVTVDAPQRPPSFLVGHLLPRPAVSRNDSDVVRPSTSFTIDRNQQHETVLGVIPGGSGESEVNSLTLDGDTNAQSSGSFLPRENAFRFLLGGGAMVGPVLAPAADAGADLFGPLSSDPAVGAQFPGLSSPVPEPGTWLLLTVSLGILAAGRRLRGVWCR